MDRKRLIFVAKLVVSLGIVAFLYSKVIARDGTSELLHRLSNLSWSWVALGLGAQLFAMSCSIARWRLLLAGQGIHAPVRHLLGSFMIGRFFGEFAPGGWTGLNGYRIYDIAKHTGKLARATACIGIEMVLGWIAFGAVVIFGSLFGVRFLGLPGVLMIDAFFLGLLVAGIVLVSKPTLFRVLAARAPKQLQGKLRTTVDAVCAYEGKGRLVAQAALLGVGTHVFRAFIYVCAARALAAELSAGEVFFGSSLQIFATLLPASVNGIGLREATAVALYTRVGIPQAVAVLIPTLGFLIEMFLSSFGGLVFMARRVGYTVSIRVDNPEHEDAVVAQLQTVPKERWPRALRGLSLGWGAGLLGGALLGTGEAAEILRSSAAAHDLSVLWYGGLSYGLLFGVLGAAAGVSLAMLGRVMQRQAVPEPLAFARYAALLVSACAFAVTAFRIRRDFFHEELVWKSGHGLLLASGCALAAVLLYLVLATSLRLLASARAGAWLLRPWGGPLAFLLVVAPLYALAASRPSPHALPNVGARKAAPAGAGNVLVLVVDTLRADHLPAYGYAAGNTPNLDRFAREDAVRFDQAFANASWTRPSFASLLTGRYASSHRTMAKSDALPGELVTLPEALQAEGYSTYGIATNYNVAPFFNFQQGFDHYRYLEPAFVLGANDTAAKLLLIQALRQRIETARAKSGRVEVGSAYRDAAVVNDSVLNILDHKPRAPFFLFVGYMDPHDPYYPHPYDGTAYSRAAHQTPDPADAGKLVQLYDGEITYWDAHFGRLIRELQRRGLYDDLTLIVTSDHGEEFMDHGGFWHGTTLYDEQLRVPLLLKLPGKQLHGRVVTHWVQSIDLMPSVLKLAGIATPKGVQGADFFTGHEHAFAEESHEGNVLHALRSLRAGTHVKLITANEGNPRGLAQEELYRVDQDPSEKVNLAADDPPLATTMRSALAAQQKSAALGKAATRSVDVNADTNAGERLRALGYAGGEEPK